MDWSVPYVRNSGPRHLLGIGEPETCSPVSSLGWINSTASPDSARGDMARCTRGRGRISLTSVELREDPGANRRWVRLLHVHDGFRARYLRHLFAARAAQLYARFLSTNLWFIERLMAEIRAGCCPE